MDLIELGKTFDPTKRKRHNINLRRLANLVDPLEKLQNMVGMTKLKNSMFELIIKYLQELDSKNTDMLHTIIEGPPGVGKTCIAEILAKIYCRLGFLKKDTVLKVKVDDLIGEYVGQTAPRTRKQLEKALGGVLFIDEAYSIGKCNSYAEQAIDMITSYLDQHPHDLVCMIAGYKDSIKKDFLDLNEGLSRRFTTIFTLEKYTGDELRSILMKIIKDNNWDYDDDINSESVLEVFNLHNGQNKFTDNGGDMLNLFACCKKTHCLRLMNLETKTEEELIKAKKKINKDDLVSAIKLFIDGKNKDDSNPPFAMYT